MAQKRYSAQSIPNLSGPGRGKKHSSYSSSTFMTRAHIRRLEMQLSQALFGLPITVEKLIQDGPFFAL